MIEVFIHSDLIHEIFKYINSNSTIAYFSRTCKTIYNYLTTLSKPIKIDPYIAYCYAIENNHQSIVKYLVDCDYPMPYCAPMVAARGDNIGILKHLYQSGASLSCCMRIAVIKRNKELITYLASVYKETDVGIIRNIHIDDFIYLMSVDYFSPYNMLLSIFDDNRIDLLDYLIKNYKISITSIIGFPVKISREMKDYLLGIDAYLTLRTNQISSNI